MVAGRLDANGTDDGPAETAYICSPSGFASRGECLYFAEHPLDKQGAIRVLCIPWRDLQTFKLFGKVYRSQWGWFPSCIQ